MKKWGNVILLFLINLFFISCGNDDKKQPEKEVIYPVNKLKPVSEKIFKKSSVDTIEITKELQKNTNKGRKTAFYVKKEIEIKPVLDDSEETAKSKPLDESSDANKSLMSFVNLHKILTRSRIGETLTQKQLTQNFEIPEEALKLVKSITKTADDEIAVKWHKTWLVEKISDAKFKDGLMKITFKANKLYTSGTAIGIKYDKKIHNELIIIGRSAYIPGVKGYKWQIGR